MRLTLSAEENGITLGAGLVLKIVIGLTSPCALLVDDCGLDIIPDETGACLCVGADGEVVVDGEYGTLLLGVADGVEE